MASRTIGVVGAGTMGSGIAQLAAQNGFDVVIRDIEQELVDEGLARIEENLAEAEEREIIDDADATFDLVSGTTDIEMVADRASFIVEAAPE